MYGSDKMYANTQWLTLCSNTTNVYTLTQTFTYAHKYRCTQLYISMIVNFVQLITMLKEYLLFGNSKIERNSNICPEFLKPILHTNKYSLEFFVDCIPIFQTQHTCSCESVFLHKWGYRRAHVVTIITPLSLVIFSHFLCLRWWSVAEFCSTQWLLRHLIFLQSIVWNILSFGFVLSQRYFNVLLGTSMNKRILSSYQ